MVNLSGRSLAERHDERAEAKRVGKTDKLTKKETVLIVSIIAFPFDYQFDYQSYKNIRYIKSVRLI